MKHHVSIIDNKRFRGQADFCEILDVITHLLTDCTFWILEFTVLPTPDNTMNFPEIESKAIAVEEGISIDQKRLTSMFKTVSQAIHVMIKVTSKLSKDIIFEVVDGGTWEVKTEDEQILKALEFRFLIENLPYD